MRCGERTWMKYPCAVGMSPVRSAPAPSASEICLKPPMKPLLYLRGSSCMRVLTTSTGVRAPWVRLQQMPPESAPGPGGQRRDITEHRGQATCTLQPRRPSSFHQCHSAIRRPGGRLP
eukprot:scaffold22268_cov123-Isochrysis_galbana.AAC.3